MSSMLKSIKQLGQPSAGPVAFADSQLERVVDCGLGPLYRQLLTEQHISTNARGQELLLSADLTARAIAGRSRAATTSVLDLLRKAGLRFLVLKGADMAQRFYPEFHWRIMRDIDLLLESPEQAREASGVLMDHGFAPNPEEAADRWDQHHHLAPLHHRDLGIWVELHHGLYPHYSPFAEEPLFRPERCFETAVTQEAYGGPCEFLATEVARAHCICHWYSNLMEDFGQGGHQRSIVDCYFMSQFPLPVDAAPVTARAFTLMADTMARQLGAPLKLVSGSSPIGLVLLRRWLDTYVGQFHESQRDVMREIIGRAFMLGLLSTSRFQFFSGLLSTTFSVFRGSLSARTAGAH